MTAVLLALGSSLAYGLTDFLGGLAARRVHILMLGALTQPLGLLLLLAVAPLWGGTVSGDVWFWGLVSGIGGAGLANRERSDRYATRHLDDGQQGIEAIEGRRGYRNAEHR